MQTIEQGDIFGRIGKAIGQGVSEQAERSMLGNQLSKIPNLPKEVSQLIKSPGGREILPTVMPFIQNRGASQETLNQAGVPVEGAQNKSAISPGSVETPTEKVSRLSVDPESISVRAAQRQMRNPLRFPTLDAAIAYEKNRAETQQSQINTVRGDFDEIMQSKIQKGGKETYKDVLGDLQENFKEKAEEAVLSGKMTDKEAARHFGDKALDFAKARNKFTVPGRDFWRSAISSSPLKEVRAAKKAYDAVDMPEAFLNDLVAQRGFSLPIASELAFPPTSKAQDFFSDLKYSGRVNKNDPKIYEKVSDLFTSKDSLQSFASELNRKGYDPVGFLDYMSEKKLTPFQERELENFGTFQPSLSDILYFTMSGKKP